MLLMSFSLTPDQILDRTKRVTRRLGWLTLREGDLICAVRKRMGLRKGESIERLAVLRVTEIRRENLGKMLEQPDYGAQECIQEGFGPGSACPDPAYFVNFFCLSHRDASIHSNVTRIAFDYVHRPEQRDYQRAIVNLLRPTMSKERAQVLVSDQRRSIGRHWADGCSAHQVVRKLWPESLQLALPGFATDTQHHSGTLSKRTQSANSRRPAARKAQVGTP